MQRQFSNTAHLIANYIQQTFPQQSHKKLGETSHASAISAQYRLSCHCQNPKGEAACLYNSHCMQSPLATRQGPCTLQQGVHRGGPSTRQPRGKAGQLSADTARPSSTHGHAQQPEAETGQPTARFSQSRPPHCTAPRALTTNSGAKRRCYVTPPPAESLTQLHSHQQ